MTGVALMAVSLSVTLGKKTNRKETRLLCARLGSFSELKPTDLESHTHTHSPVRDRNKVEIESQP